MSAGIHRVGDACFICYRICHIDKNIYSIVKYNQIKVRLPVEIFAGRFMAIRHIFKNYNSIWRTV